MLTWEEKDGRFFVYGKGMVYLKCKSAVGARVGSDAVRHEGRECFSFSSNFLSAVADLLTDVLENESQIRSVLNSIESHAEACRRALQIIEEQSEGSPIPPWDSILDHLQAVAVNAMCVPGLRGLCLFDEQGAGKTVMTLAAFDTLKESDQADAMIVVCPKSMAKEWESDCNRFLKEKYHITLTEGDVSEKFCQVTKESDILVINFDGISRLRVAIEARAAKCRTVLAVDESFYVKNPDALRSDAVRSLRDKCCKAFVLCGTPAPNSPLDLVNQFDIADNGFTFRGFKPSGDLEKDRPRLVEAIESRGLYLRRLKTTILPELPEKQFSILPVQLSGRQAQIYQEARDNLVLWLRGMDSRAFKKNVAGYFAKRQTLLQICACPSVIDPLFTELPAKYTVLDNLLDDLIICQEKKVVLWSFYRRSLDEVAERYGKFGLVRVDGTTPGKDRRESIKRFQADQEVRLFLGNPAAAGAGITLHAAADAVYLSYPGQAAHYLQSLDRIHRRGQTASDIRYHLLVCSGTVEEGEVRRLRRKEIEQHDLLGDDVSWPSSIDDALADLETCF